MRNLYLILLGILLAIPTYAHSFTYTYEGQTLNYNVLNDEDKSVEVTNSNKQISGDLIIPEIVKDNDQISYTVISIGENAFEGCSGLTSVSIPNSITQISYMAFFECSNLTSVSIPNSVTFIGYYAFEGCFSLIKAEFASVESLCNIDFNDASSNPLFYANNLWVNGKEIKELIIPNSVTRIRKNAFYGGSGLISVTIPNSVTHISDDAFSDCSGLTSLIIPNSVTYIGDDAFSYCSGLTSVTLPNSLTSIGERVFYKCSSLISLTIPDSVTTILESAFSGCSSLTSVTLPSSLNYIGNYAFEFCDDLTSIYYESDNPISGSIYIFSGPTYSSAILYMTEAGIANGLDRDPWKNFINVKTYNFSGVDEITAGFDTDAPFELFDINGVKVGVGIDSLHSGIYIVRQNNIVRKIEVK